MKTPRIKFSHLTIARTPGLLPMLYRPAEIAEELEINLRTLYDWLKLGAPHVRDKSGHLWIDGEKFKEWVDNNRKRRTPGKKLADDEAYCFRCRQAIKLVNPSITPVQGRLHFIKGKCPNCGCTINRGACHDHTTKLAAS